MQQVGTFVPFNERPLRGNNSRNVGWVVMENGCHIWCSISHPKGYGYVRYGGRNRPAHVARYEREIGPVPPGMQLDHYVCNNPSCCNPAHVRPATSRENTLRGNTVTSANAAKARCHRGHPLSGENLMVTRGSSKGGAAAVSDV